MIQFCNKCGSILRSGQVNQDKFYTFCDNCHNFESDSKENFKSSITTEKVLKLEERGEGTNKEENIFADYDNICRKCGHNKAQILDLGIFYSDEDNLILLKCGKCGFSERVGRKVS